MLLISLVNNDHLIIMLISVIVNNRALLLICKFSFPHQMLSQK